jgi:hypothetical protein
MGTLAFRLWDNSVTEGKAGIGHSGRSRTASGSYLAPPRLRCER